MLHKVNEKFKNPEYMNKSATTYLGYLIGLTFGPTVFILLILFPFLPGELQMLVVNALAWIILHRLYLRALPFIVSSHGKNTPI